jgi:hypothetical protein
MGDRGTGVRFVAEARNLSLLHSIQATRRPTQPPFQWLSATLSPGQSVRGVKLTSHLYLVPRLIMRADITPYVFMALFLIDHRDNFTVRPYALPFYQSVNRKVVRSTAILRCKVRPVTRPHLSNDGVRNTAIDIFLFALWRKRNEDMVAIEPLVSWYSCATAKCASLPGLLFDPEDGISTLIRNVGKLLPDYTASRQRRWQPTLHPSLFWYGALSNTSESWPGWLV